jgi:hypothetical protein
MTLYQGCPNPDHIAHIPKVAGSNLPQSPACTSLPRAAIRADEGGRRAGSTSEKEVFDR